MTEMAVDPVILTQFCQKKVFPKCFYWSNLLIWGSFTTSSNESYVQKLTRGKARSIIYHFVVSINSLGGIVGIDANGWVVQNPGRFKKKHILSRVTKWRKRGPSKMQTVAYNMYKTCLGHCFSQKIVKYARHCLFSGWVAPNKMQGHFWHMFLI